MGRTSAWISAFRLRTLPLALSCIFVGSALAHKAEAGKMSVFALALTTTILLQVLSNLANDLGDHLHGADNQDRVGPQRAVQSGAITSKQMKLAVVLLGLLSLGFGSWLVVVSLSELGIWPIAGFLLLGLLAIAAAVKYTYGRNPYGYAGMGDLFVFLFFGLIGVIGSEFLFTKQFDLISLWPAISIGTFSTGVLNINNMRDMDNDRKVGKLTIAARLGLPKAKLYQAVLVVTGCCTAIAHTLLSYTSLWQWLYLLVFPVFALGLVRVFKAKDHAALDPELKKLALGTFAFALLFSLGLTLG